MWRSNISLEDFLLFSERVYDRMFELHNQALWPLHLLTLAIGLFLIAAAVYPRPGRIRAAFALLSGLWVFVAVAFVYGRYANINWAAAYLLPLFGFVALILAYLSVRMRQPLMEYPLRISQMVATGVLVFAVVGFPLLAVMDGRSLGRAEIFGISPDPTALATIAFLSLNRGSGVFSAMLVASLWIVVTALTLYTLGRWEFFVAPLAAAVCLAAGAVGMRRRSETAV